MADPTFDAIYVGSNYDASVTVPSGLSATHLVAFVAAFGSSTDSITMSGWTQQTIAGASNGSGEDVRQAVFTRSYAAGTYSPTLGGSLGSYLVTIYAVNDVGTIGASASNAANGENPPTYSASPTISANGALVIGAVTQWGSAPAAGDITGTWSNNLGPPTLLTPYFSEQRSWYNSQNAGSASFSVTASLVAPDTGVAGLVVIEAASNATISPSSVSSAEAHGSATASASGAATVAPGGVATAQAFGTAALAAGPSTVSPSSVASGEAHGTTAVSASGAATVSPSGVATAQAFGTASLSGSAATISPSSIATAFASGTPVCTPSGAASIQIGTPPPRIFVFSNSLGQGVRASTSDSIYGLVGSSGLIARFPTATIVDVAYGGADTQDLIAYFDADVAHVIRPGDIGIVWEGVNDIAAGMGGQTPAQAATNLQTLAARITGKGAKCIMVGCAPQDATVPEVQDIDDLNALLRANAPTYATLFLDFDVDLTGFSPAGTANSNPRYSDAVHFSDQGYQETLDYIADGVDYLIGSGIASVFAAGSPALTALSLISPSAIASLQAFGTTVLSASAMTISPSAIATAQAFGTSALTPSGAAPIAPSAVATAESHGAAALTPGGVTVSPSSVATGEAHGTAALTPSGSATVAPDGVATAESVSSPALLAGAFLAPAGIASTETFGTSVVSGSGPATPVAPSGVATAEAMPGPVLTPGVVTVSPSAIASAQAFGTAALASGGAVITPGAIASLEQHGTTVLSGTGGAPLSTTGIASLEAFGSSSLAPGGVTLSLTGIATSEAWGIPALASGAAVISPQGLVTGELFGVAAVDGTGTAFISPSSVLTSEAFGLLTLSTGALLRIVSLRSNWTHTPGRDLLSPTWSREQ